MDDKCGICGTPSKDDLFSAVTREPVCSLCKINYIGGLPTTPERISDARLELALVGGNTLKITRRNRDDAVGRVILRKVAEFWAMVHDDRPPPPDFTRDAKLIAALYNRSNPGEVIDMTGDSKANELVFYYASTQESIAVMQREIDKYKAQLLEIIGTAEKAFAEHWSISAKEVAGSEGKIVTQDMVGTYINQRKGYRRFAVTIKKEEK